MRKILVALALLTLTASCSSRKMIDDKTLATIFKEAYITNAFLGVRYMNLDSLQIYEPILDKYGYTPEDLR